MRPPPVPAPERRPTPRPRPGRAAVLAGLAVLGASLLTGCTDDRPPGFTGVRLTTATVSTYFPASPDLSDVVVERQVRGPHSALGIGWIATATELGPADGDALGTGPLRAAEGGQLIVVVLDPQRTARSESPAAVGTAVVVDGAETPVDALPPAGTTASGVTALVIGARLGAEVRLRLTDAGRAQELSLPAGTPVPSDDAYVRGTASPPAWEGDRHVGQGGGTGTLSALHPLPGPDRPPALRWTTYLDGRSWAAPGRMFLLVSMPVLSCVPDPPLGSCITLHQQFDDAEVFTFRTGAGGTAVAAPARRDVDLLGFAAAPDPVPVVFDVPRDAAGGTVVLDLGRARLLQRRSTPAGQEVDEPTEWDTAPEPFTLSVDLSG